MFSNVFLRCYVCTLLSLPFSPINKNYVPISQCLKITQNVSFIMASEVSGQKFDKIKNDVKCQKSKIQMRPFG